MPATNASARPPEQIVFGFAEKFVALMRQKGGVTDPVRYGKTFTLVHDPLVWREAADHLLREAGVKVLFHTIVIDAVVEDGRVNGAVTVDQTRKSAHEGAYRHSMQAAMPDVAELAGFETFVGQDGKVQNPTMIFRLMGVDVERFVAHFGPDTILGDDSVLQMIRNLQQQP